MEKKTMTLKDAAALLGVRSTRAVRYILKLQSSSVADIVRGYDARGRILLDADMVAEEAIKRQQRGKGRTKNLGNFTRKAPRNRDGQRMCYRLNCRATVTDRHRLCERHRGPVSPPA